MYYYYPEEDDWQIRNELILKLERWYNYSLKTWERMTTAQLWAIYNRGEPKRKKKTSAKRKKISRLTYYEPKIIVRNGMKFIKNDNGEYVDYYD